MKSYSGGCYHACAIASDDKVYCAGFGQYGQLGDNDTADNHEPDAVNTSGVLNGKKIVVVTSGYDHTCALDNEHKAYCWGYNGFGQFGNNTTSSVNVLPVAVNSAP